MRPALAKTLVFATSAAVLVIEILAVRILAPYLGVSLEVFTGIIGVILAGISLGAWMGGRAADRIDPTRLVGPLMLAGGLATLAAPPIIDLIGPTLSTSAGSIVMATAIGFLLPAALLSAVSPVIVKIQLGSLAETGRVVGTYSAIGTAGAILGTFATGFVLIAAFPTRPIVAVVGALLTVTGVILWSTRTRWALASLGGAAVLALALFLGDGPCQYETTYHCANVVVDGTRPTGRTLVLDRISNSYVDLDDPTYLQFRYIKLFADVIAATSPPGSLDVVSIGGGGFTMPGYLIATRPGSLNVVLEIDSLLVDIGREHLGLEDMVDVVVDDARISLRDIDDGWADLVIGDAYSGTSVPWHLTTQEYTEDIRRVLDDDGIYLMNVIDYGGLRFARAAALTLDEVFEDVALFAPTDYLAGEAGGNFVLVAADRPLDTTSIKAAIRERGGFESGISGPQLDAFTTGARLLRDDFAPVDQMLGRP